MPPVTQALLFANVAVFAATFLLKINLLPFALWPLGDPGRGLPFLPWQLITYSFLHASVAHLLVNMLALVMFGSAIEQYLGSRRYLYYYAACVFSGALTHLFVSALMGAPPVPTVGASGGVFGLLLAFGMFFPRRQVMLLFPPIPMEARVLVVLYGGIELLLGVTGRLPGVAHFAHLGGMLGGLLMILYLRRARGRP